MWNCILFNWKSHIQFNRSIFYHILKYLRWIKFIKFNKLNYGETWATFTYLYAFFLLLWIKWRNNTNVVCEHLILLWLIKFILSTQWQFHQGLSITRIECYSFSHIQREIYWSHRTSLCEWNYIPNAMGWMAGITKSCLLFFM